MTKANLEMDMKDAPWFVKKVRGNHNYYAQRVYATLCNNEFQKLDVLEILKDSTWSCSWRYAGGLIADIRCEGDYMDWYCSGDEGKVDDEVKQDFEKLGWVPIADPFADDDFV